VPLYLGGIALYSLAVYGAYVWISTSKSIHREPVQAKALNEQEDISYVYDTIAKKYDKDIWTSEFFMGLPLLRRSMAKRARVRTVV
jgi:methyltransferase OMS1